jgi:hypothetical protein
VTSLSDMPRQRRRRLNAWDLLCRVPVATPCVPEIAALGFV